MANLFSEKPIVKTVMLKGQDGEEKLINQADGSGVSFWIGTQAEYDAIPAEELIENCIYYITDDTRDDFRTDLNALDTKVDNNTSKMINTTLVIYDYSLFSNEAKEILESYSIIRAVKRSGFIYLKMELYFKTEMIPIAGSRSFTLFNAPELACFGLNYAQLFFETPTLSGDARTTIYTNGDISLYLTDTITIENDYINTQFIYPAKEV